MSDEYKATFLNIVNNIVDNVDNTQLKDNCIVVYNLIFFGFLQKESERLRNYLSKFESGAFTRRGTKNLEKTLDTLIKTGIKKMGGNMVMTNIPKQGILRDADVEEEVNCIHIYDTIEQFIAPQKVVKMSNNTYVIFFDRHRDAINVTNKLDGMLISGNPINAYTVDPDIVDEFRDLRSIRRATTCDYRVINSIFLIYLAAMMYLALYYKSQRIPDIN
jgi:hypothetical protein